VDALHAQQPELAAACREDGRELGRGAGAAGPLLLASDAGRRPRGRLVLGLVLLRGSWLVEMKSSVYGVHSVIIAGVTNLLVLVIFPVLATSAHA